MRWLGMSTSRMRFSFDSTISTPVAIGRAPPDSPVPWPRATNGTLCWWHSRTICWTSAALEGSTTQPGVWCRRARPSDSYVSISVLSRRIPAGPVMRSSSAVKVESVANMFCCSELSGIRMVAWLARSKLRSDTRAKAGASCMHRRILAAIVMMAAAVRFWGIRFGLPHTFTRPDETIIIDVALSFLRGNLRPAFYDYPWLYMWALAALYLLYYAWGRIIGAFHSVADMVAMWPINWIPFFLIPRALSAVLGTTTVLVVYRIGRRLSGETTGVVAALFMALAFLHVRDSHFATTDVAMTFLLMQSISLLIDAHLSKRPRDFVIAGIVGGLAAATKYNALL